MPGQQKRDVSGTTMSAQTIRRKTGWTVKIKNQSTYLMIRQQPHPVLQRSPIRKSGQHKLKPVCKDYQYKSQEKLTSKNPQRPSLS